MKTKFYLAELVLASLFLGSILFEDKSSPATNELPIRETKIMPTEAKVALAAKTPNGKKALLASNSTYLQKKANKKIRMVNESYGKSAIAASNKNAVKAPAKLVNLKPRINTVMAAKIVPLQPKNSINPELISAAREVPTQELSGEPVARQEKKQPAANTRTIVTNVAYPAKANETMKVKVNNETVTTRNLTLVDNSAIDAAEETESKTVKYRGKLNVKYHLLKYIPPQYDGFSEEIGTNRYDAQELTRKANKLANMAKQRGYNTEYAFLIDMGMKSSKKRFFVINLKTMSIEMSGMVAHGKGKEKFSIDKDYSDQSGSRCTSLGIYKMGRQYEGDFGMSYKMHGLDPTNKNAEKRAIVLHAMGVIPNEETNFPIWQSEGCPSVSPDFLESLKGVMEKNKKPILMWIFDDNYLPDEATNTGDAGQ
ncbi:murein L,D-transpeptidase catalytic domain family protein [Flavihumibacter rivuli]|uniref:murein L,D-transpeptidase catalytic domain-containing protein n=1 Tax=Flavihumibacter rivuli TaxID=2838156 RepID=UPI001BDE9F5B|nr:murein L,D-transpeptidase catalytic domain family protein [Flavihumibacter rivuli]ULQ56153.1 murein L,D-transpeptidase catalytic domain family protein [Flavihumibacter rivuli]